MLRNSQTELERTPAYCDITMTRTSAWLSFTTKSLTSNPGSTDMSLAARIAFNVFFELRFSKLNCSPTNPLRDGEEILPLSSCNMKRKKERKKERGMYKVLGQQKDRVGVITCMLVIILMSNNQQYFVQFIFCHFNKETSSARSYSCRVRV